MRVDVWDAGAGDNGRIATLQPGPFEFFSGMLVGRNTEGHPFVFARCRPGGRLEIEAA